MKILLRRDQRAGGMLGGKTVFVLTVRAVITPAEQAAIGKYKLGDTMLYAREQLRLENDSVGEVAKFWVKHMLNLKVQVKDLVEGKVIECKEIIEMLAAEDQLKEAARNFKQVLDAASHFGGEEVVEL